MVSRGSRDFRTGLSLIDRKDAKKVNGPLALNVCITESAQLCGFSFKNFDDLWLIFSLFFIYYVHYIGLHHVRQSLHYRQATFYHVFALLYD